jgi:endoglucanase
MSTPDTTAMPAEAANHRLARTINLGLDLGAPEEAGWTLGVGDEHLERCAQAGFSAVRLGACFGLHRLAPDSHQLHPGALERLERVIVAASERGLAVVVANLRDPQLMADPPSHRERLLAGSRQLAEAIKHHGPSVALEPLSEPQLELDRVWNRYLRELCATVRDVDPGRTLVVGPRSYNNARFLPELELPENERNLILTVHHYWPITFTMQGETWLGQTELGDPRTWLGTTWDATPQQRAELEAGFDAVAAYARSHGRPVFIGEFGTTSNADMPSRVRWTRFNRELAEQHGFAWGCWSYGPSFAVYDADHHRWHTELLHALLPRCDDDGQGTGTVGRYGSSAAG